MRTEREKGKLGEKGTLMNFVGYTDNFQNFRFHNPGTRQVTIACDAIFVPTVGPIKDNLSTIAPTSVVF